MSDISWWQISVVNIFLIAKSNNTTKNTLSYYYIYTKTKTLLSCTSITTDKLQKLITLVVTNFRSPSFCSVSEKHKYLLPFVLLPCVTLFGCVVRIVNLIKMLFFSQIYQFCNINCCCVTGFVGSLWVLKGLPWGPYCSNKGEFIFTIENPHIIKTSTKCNCYLSHGFQILRNI